MAAHIHSLTAIFKTKKTFSDLQKKYALIENKTIGCSQMPVDCLRASKLVTLGLLILHIMKTRYYS